MGHLFSRAIKRLTFGASGSSSSSKSASRNQLPGNDQQEQSSSQREPDLNRPTVQAIPVGQSIDSAEYAAFENASSAPLPRAGNLDDVRHTTPPTTQEVTQEAPEDVKEPEEVAAAAEAESEQANQPEVEEAVIKIQALVRGHLTRKALKDARVTPNTLGQRQFDEESLIKNPPSAIFLPTSPLSSSSPNNEAFNSGLQLQQQQQQQPQQSNKHANSRVPPLESIAEDEVETAINPQQETSSAAGAISEEGQRRRLSSAKRQTSGGANSSSNDDSAAPSSPQPPSTANASIDIHCDTPASVSLDILDHTSKPNFGIASVLHHQPAVPVEAAAENLPAAEERRESVGAAVVASEDGELQPADEDEVNVLPDISGIPAARLAASFVNNAAETAATVTSSLPASPPHINLAAATGTNSHSIDSAEAAAIRIQSAFRGYHTRKHSPYRRRSPANALPDDAPAAAQPPQMNGFGHANESPLRRSLLRQPDAREDEEADEEQEEENDDDDEGVVGTFDQQPALVSTSSFEDEQQEARKEQQEQDPATTAAASVAVAATAAAAAAAEAELQRLEVVSPDEAIGSGRSSPALVSSNSNSGDDEDGGGEQDEADKAARPESSPQQGGSGGGTKSNKKRNRNKRKGKK